MQHIQQQKSARETTYVDSRAPNEIELDGSNIWWSNYELQLRQENGFKQRERQQVEKSSVCKPKHAI